MQTLHVPVCWGQRQIRELAVTHVPTVSAEPPVGTCHPGLWLLEEPTPTPLLVLLMEVTASPRAGLDITCVCACTHTHIRACVYTHSSHFRLGSHTCCLGRAFLASATSRAGPSALSSSSPCQHLVILQNPRQLPPSPFSLLCSSKAWFDSSL